MNSGFLDPKLARNIYVLGWVAFAAYTIGLLLIYRADQHGGAAVEGGRLIQLLYYGTFVSIWAATAVLFFNRRRPFVSPFPRVSILIATVIILSLVLTVGLLFVEVRHILVWLGCMLMGFLYIQGNPNSLPRLGYYMAALMIPIAIIIVLRERGTVTEGAVFNEIYWLLPFLPWCFVVNRRKVELFGVFLASVVVVWSAKRGAAIGLGAMLLSMYLTSVFIQKGGADVLVRGIRVALILFCVGGALFYIDSARDGVLLSRLGNITTDEGRGRIDMYLAVIESLKTFGFAELIFGRGYYSAAYAMHGPINVHNDWLQMIHNFGLIGLTLYVCFQGIIIWRYIDAVRRGDRIAVPLIGMYALFFCLSLYSIGIFSSRFFMMAAAVGVFVGFAEISRELQGKQRRRMRAGPQPHIHPGGRERSQGRLVPVR